MTLEDQLAAIPDPIDRLDKLHAIEAALRIAVTETVQQARTEGQSWAAIGAALGMSRQAAHERFSTGAPLDQPTAG